MNTDIRLAYRIASMPPAFPHPSMMDHGVQEEHLVETARSLSDIVAKCPKFLLGNVADFYASHDKSVWDMQADIPNWAPPFRGFFAEWNGPKRWIIDGKTTEGPEGQVGVLSIATDIPEGTRTDAEFWKTAVMGNIGWPGKLRVSDEEMLKYLSEAKWILSCTSWVATPSTEGRPLWNGNWYVLFVDGFGKLRAHMAVGLTQQRVVEEFGTDEIWSPMHVFGLGISFCHCKNVVRKETEEFRGDRWHRRSGVPLFKFYTLDINPMREVLRTEGKSDETGIQKALHICRGHFSSYSEEKPLFGKYAGTFWVPEHLRGSSEHGVVKKDYRVFPIG